MMTRRLVLFALAIGAGPVAAADCRDTSSPLSADMYVAAPEMRHLAVSTGLNCTLAEDVIARAHSEGSALVGGVAEKSAPGPKVTSAQGYVPKTKDDNTPWRFDMNQNGRRMTAEEFDAWMKAKGIHVATGKPAGSVSAEPAASGSGASTP